jgi:twinkle protein
VNTFSDRGIDLNGRTGVEVRTTCPQCSRTRNKSKACCLSVNTEKGIWVCHHCGWAGSLKQGEQHKAHFTVRPHYRPTDTLAPALMEFFESRGINTDIVQRQGIGLETVYMSQAEEEIPVVAFPYRRQGEVVNCKYRGLMSKVFRQVSHAEKILYNLDALDGQTEAVIVEGELDALAVIQAGIQNVVSVPDGAPPANSKPSDQKFEFLPNCQKELATL